MGLTVTKDAEGCLQDIHWSLGALGYFPTYSLGNLNAAQLYAAAEAAVPDLDVALGRGDYDGLLGWLCEKVHEPGSRYLPEELMRRATGRGTESAPYLSHLRARYVA